MTDATSPAGTANQQGAPQAQTNAPDPPEPPRFIRHASLVAGLTFASRLLGLVRDSVLAACFGLTVLTDAFWIAFVIPNLFRRLFGEGALTSAFIPAYTRLHRTSPQQARRLAWACIAMSAGLLVTITLLAELVIATILTTARPHGHAALAMKLTAVMLPYMPMVCLVALLAAILHVHDRFFAPATAPIILNIAMIVTAIAAARNTDTATALHFLAIAVIAAGALQLMWQFLAARRHEPPTGDLQGAWPLLRPVLAATIPTAAALAVFQVNALFDSIIAFALSPKSAQDTLHLFGWSFDAPIRQGSVTALQFAQRLYQFPLGVFGIALATAIFPALARAAADGHKIEYRNTLHKGLRIAVFIGLPATAGLVLVRNPLVRAIFQYRSFSPQDSAAVADILAGYAAAVWAYILVHLLTRAFYATQDTRTPLKVALAMVALNLSLNLILVWPLGAPALAWSTAIAAATQSLVLLYKLHRRTYRLVDAALIASVVQSAALTGTMTAALIAANRLIRYFDPPHPTTGFQLLGLVAIGAGTVFLGARLLRMPELNWIFNKRQPTNPT